MMEYSKYLGSNGSDEKYTPRYAVLPIIKYLSQKARVWCPFDTEHSEFVLALKEHKSFIPIFAQDRTFSSMSRNVGM